MKWIFNIGDGDKLTVEAPSLAEAAAVVEREWGGMVNGVVSEDYKQRVLAKALKQRAILAGFDDGTDPAVDIGTLLRPRKVKEGS